MFREEVYDTVEYRSLEVKIFHKEEMSVGFFN